MKITRKLTNKKLNQLTVGELGEKLLAPDSEPDDSSISEEQSLTKSSSVLSSGQKKRLKLKRKKARESQASLVQDDEEDDCQGLAKKSKIDRFCDSLGIGELIEKRKQKKRKLEDEKEAGKSEQVKRESDVEVVVYESYKKKPKKNQEADDHNDDGGYKAKPFNMKRARHEVFKFGIAGMDAKSKTSAKVAHALSLGAKPEKEKKVNYKQLLEEKKVEKVEKEIEREHGNRRFSLKTTVGISKNKDQKRKRNPNAVRGFDAQVGKYRDGVQIVNKRDFNKR
jgi:hypothetical protein